MSKVPSPTPGDQPSATSAAQPSGVAENALADLLLNRALIDEIRRMGRATGRDDVLSEFVRKLEGDLAGFGAAFSDYITGGDTTGAVRAAHTLKGTCRQLGAQALGDLFADIERSAKAGDYAEAKRRFDGAASLVAQSLEALKDA
jgi:HPt (histidine-containing phosphotransfer) domain-containing protein